MLVDFHTILTAYTERSPGLQSLMRSLIFLLTEFHRHPTPNHAEK